MKRKYEKMQSFRQRRIFSEAIRKQTVKDVESGKCSISEASHELGVHVITIYRWINLYSHRIKRNKLLIVEEKSEKYRSKDLQARVEELEAALGRKQMELDLLNKVIDLANEEYQTDLKKNLSSKPSSGSVVPKGKSTDTK